MSCAFFSFFSFSDRLIGAGPLEGVLSTGPTVSSLLTNLEILCYPNSGSTLPLRQILKISVTMLFVEQPRINLVKVHIFY